MPKSNIIAHINGSSLISEIALAIAQLILQCALRRYCIINAWGRKVAFTSESHSLDLDNLETTSFAKHSPYTNFGAITIKTIANQYVISMGLKAAETVNSVFPNALQDLKSKSKETVTPANSAADEILKFKSLLDMGAITQEEFDAKKKQLLGL